jgi:oxygen-independent coproporphyrinogen-3 oxidase
MVVYEKPEHAMSNLTADLVSRYSVEGPRYTSYPTALGLEPIEDPMVWSDRIRRANRTPKPVSVYVHVPFCKSLCWYCGCHKIISKDPADADHYLDLLEAELDLMATLVNEQNRVKQIHLGGGTPNILTVDQLYRLTSKLRERFRWTDTPEFSVEIDPRLFTHEQAQGLADIGVNRVSIGVQDVDTRVQEAIHRLQPSWMIAQSFDFLRDVGIQAINVDLVYGLPHQSVESMAATIDHMTALRPTRFAVYHYAHLPSRFPSQKLIQTEALPAPETKTSILLDIIRRLAAAGYVHIGMDHFALPDDALAIAAREGTLHRNFQGYSTHSGLDLYAFGVSSISHVDGTLIQNEKDIGPYGSAVRRGRLPWAKAYAATTEDRLRRDVIMGIMCQGHVDWEQLSRVHQLDAERHFVKERLRLIPLMADGLVDAHDHTLDVTSLGRFFLRNIAMVFDAHPSRSWESRYSKTC